MRNTLLFIVAIPLGFIASAILPNILVFIYKLLSPAYLNDFWDNYFIKSFCGWIAIAIPILIVPSYKILFGSIMLGISLLSTIYMYSTGDDFNYLFLLGGGAALFYYKLDLSKEN